MTPKQARDQLIQGNERFRTQHFQVHETQKPFAVVLSCIDSRTAPERIFDQDLGNILSLRVPGPSVNANILGSLEFACTTLGTQLVVILGHTDCGAITAARNGTLKPWFPDLMTADSVDAAAHVNVELILADIRRESPLLSKLEQSGDLAIVGALYDLRTGHVHFSQFC